MTQKHYVNGKIFHSTQWFSSGQEKSQRLYKNKYLTKLMKWYPDGKLKLMETYSRGKRVNTVWYANTMSKN